MALRNGAIKLKHNFLITKHPWPSNNSNIERNITLLVVRRTNEQFLWAERRRTLKSKSLFGICFRSDSCDSLSVKISIAARLYCVGSIKCLWLQSATAALNFKQLKSFAIFLKIFHACRWCQCECEETRLAAQSCSRKLMLNNFNNLTTSFGVSFASLRISPTIIKGDIITLARFGLELSVDITTTRNANKHFSVSFLHKKCHEKSCFKITLLMCRNSFARNVWLAVI